MRESTSDRTGTTCSLEQPFSQSISTSAMYRPAKAIVALIRSCTAEQVALDTPNTRYGITVYSRLSRLSVPGFLAVATLITRFMPRWQIARMTTREARIVGNKNRIAGILPHAIHATSRDVVAVLRTVAAIAVIAPLVTNSPISGKLT